MAAMMPQPEGTYWHFLRADKRLCYGDGREVKVGETLTIGGSVKLCKHGFHASEQVIDALSHAPGSVACLVTLGGEIIHDSDKSVASERTALWIFDAETLLREFACTIAENALFAERAAGREPDPSAFAAIAITRRWMLGEATGVERADASRAAYNVANNAPLITSGAAQNAAYSAAYSAASSASPCSAFIAANSAALSAAYRAVYSAAYNSESSAALSAARINQNALLTSMLMREYAKDTDKAEENNLS